VILLHMEIRSNDEDDEDTQLISFTLEEYTREERQGAAPTG